MVRNCRVLGFRDVIRGVAGEMVRLLLVCLGMAATAIAQSPGHSLHHGVMPPGAIGSRQLLRGGPLPGFFQPVEIKAPNGALISLASGGQFSSPLPAPLRAALLVGAVYRLRVSGIPLSPGVEVFPSIELIDRLYTPIAQEWRFPIPIELTQDDLQLALDGKFVTRVIYLEDPEQALPVKQAATQSWFEVGPGRDPLVEADALGRPVAILRLGARLPNETLDEGFLFGSPPFVLASTANQGRELANQKRDLASRRRESPVNDSTPAAQDTR
jgi:hypothetical protein